MGLINNPLRRITGATLGSAAQVGDLEQSLRKANADGSRVDWAFRGQPGTYGSLRPTFQRAFPSKDSDTTASQIEAGLIRSFRIHYARLYASSSGLPDPALIAEANELACLSVMQHYGVPTRMLDWTSNFWVAVYFACSGEPEQDAELWLYDRSIFLKSSADQIETQSNAPTIAAHSSEPFVAPCARLSDLQGKMIAEVMPTTSPRLRHQSGHHTVSHGIFDEHAIRLDRLANLLRGPKTSRFRRILIESSAKQNILTYLEKFQDINAATIYPDLEGLAMFLRLQFKSLVTLLYSREA